MAINRFSTIQGLPEWQPQIPLDILVKGLTYKQELFDKNKALLETNVSLGKSVADLILNDEAKKYTQDKINSYKNYLNTNLAYADLTDDAVMKSADTKLGDVTNDMDIVNWVSKSKNTTKEMNRIDELKKKGDARYDQLHENSFMLDVSALKTSSMKDGLNLGTPSYTDFYDADKEKQELIKNFKPNHIKYSKVLPNGRMMDIEDQSVYQEQLQAYLEANLSDKAKRELAFRGEYEYKAGYQYEKDDTRKQNFANNISNRYLGIVDGQIKAIDTQIEVMKQQQFKLDPKDKNYDAELSQIKNNIDLYERQKQNHVNDKELFLKDPTKYTKDISQRLYISSYVATAAKGNTRIDKSETLKSDEAYWSGLNYNLSERKFVYDQKKDALNLELEYFKAGIKRDKDGNLIQENAFGTTGSAGGGFTNLSFGSNETIDPTEGGGLEFVREVEKGVLAAKEQIYNDYFRKWEQEAAGSNGFFTPEQKAEWNKQDAAWKKDYFQQKVLPLYHRYMEGNNFSMEMPDGTKVTRNANYVPQWFKDMRNDPRYRNTYTALSVATAVKNNISETYKDYDGVYQDRTGQKLSATDLAEMSQLQELVEDSKYAGFHDANTLNNLKRNIDNYIESGGSSTGSGFVDLARTLGPGTNFDQQQIAELSRKFGDVRKLKKVVDNLLYNTREGSDLLAFGGYAISNAFQSNIPGATKPFERLSDETRTVINNAIGGMVISQPKFNVINKENDFYKKRQNPDAIALANQALDDGGRINNFSLNSNSFEFEGISGGGEMTFSYTKGDLSEGKSYTAMTQTLARIADASGGKITYDGEANTLRIKVDPKRLGILQDYTDLYQSRVLFDSGYLTSLPSRNYYARDPKQNLTKGFSYQFSKNSAGQTELAFYRDGKKITIPRITEAEAKAAGVMVTSDFLDLDPSGADLTFSRYLSQYDQAVPGNNYNSLDKLINYAENNQ
jgi:hypothetical protein